VATQTVDFIAANPAPPKSVKAAGRLGSLDAYRGFIMLLLASSGFGLAVLANHPGWGWLAYQVDHSEWEGCTLWDLIQPAFTFMVGVAMPFAFANRLAKGATQGQILRHVVSRAVLLIVLSNIYSNWGSPQTRPLVFQLINVLCQIAFGYVICALILRLRFPFQVAVAVAMLAGHWALFVIFPGPGGVAFSQTGNIGDWLDLKLLGHSYSGNYTTLNAVGNAVTILFGCWTGMLLQTERSHAYKLKVLSICAACGFATGLLLQPFNPMVKRLWTASFTLFSAGWVILMLIVFYWIVEVKQARKWTFPFVVLGMNSIFIYSLGQIGIKSWLDRGLRSFTGNFPFLGDLGIIPQNVLVLAGMWYLCYWLYRRKIFLKI
jgi:predicted acyltransferase